MGMLVYACHSEHSLLWQNHAPPPFFFFYILSKQEQQLKNKTANKAMGGTRYSFQDPLCTLFNSGLCWGFCICYPGSICILYHLAACWWPYQNIKLFRTSSKLPSSFHLQQNDQVDNSSVPHSKTANYCKTWSLEGGYCNKALWHERYNILVVQFVSAMLKTVCWNNAEWQ